MAVSNPIKPGESGASGQPARAALVTRVALILIGVVIVVGVVGALNRGLKGRPDWGDLCHESRWMWQHGHSAPGTAMFGYLPPTSFALWPFTTWLPQPWGVLPYIVTNVAALLLSVWLVYRWWPPPVEDDRALPARGWGALFVWPVLLVSVNFAHALQSNQLTLWTLALCVGGLTLVGRRRDFAGGLVLGLAALLKIMPGVFVLYLLLRRRWRALFGMLVAVIVFDLVPCMAFFGWQGTLDEHRAWLRRAAWHSSGHLIEQPLLRVHRHGTNASLAAVLTRWLRAVPDVDEQVILYGDPPPEVVQRYHAALEPNEHLTLDPMPPRDGAWAEKRADIRWVPRFHAADLPAGVVWWIWATPLMLGLVALAWFTWRSGGDGTHSDWAAVSALWMLVMFWPSPMTRHYYLAWAFPAVVVVWQVLVTELRQRRRPVTAGTVLAVGALVAWGVGVACLGSKLLRWYGIHVAVLAILSAATAWAWHRARVRGGQRRAENRGTDGGVVGERE